MQIEFLIEDTSDVTRLYCNNIPQIFYWYDYRVITDTYLTGTHIFPELYFRFGLKAITEIDVQHLLILGYLKKADTLSCK